MILSQALQWMTAAMLVAGFGLGLVYFALVRRTADLFAAGRGLGIPVVLTLARLLAMAAFLALAARQGAAALLAAFLGVLLARMVALRRKGTTA